MGFSSKLTDEEDLLKKKYNILKKKKKILQQLRNRKKQEEKEAAESRANKITLKKKKSLIQSTDEIQSNRPQYSKGYSANLLDLKSANAAANTEAAKKLLKSGSIQLKVENKKVFKRSSKLIKRIKDNEGSAKKSGDMYQPFHSDAKADTSDSSDRDERPNVRILSTEEPKERVNRFLARRDKGRNFKRETKEHKKGNTIFVHGYGISEELLKDLFQEFGSIININVESERSGFVTFSKIDSADNAINKRNNEMVGDTRLKVSIARRQPMIESAITGGTTVWTGLANRRGEKGSNQNKEEREIQAYDDDPFG